MVNKILFTTVYIFSNILEYSAHVAHITQLIIMVKFHKYVVLGYTSHELMDN